MKTSMIFICFFILSCCCIAQETGVYKYFIHLNNYKDAPTFIKQKDVMIYSGSDEVLNVFFKEYTITEYFQAFPSSPRERDLRVFYMETLDKNLIKSLKLEFPDMCYLIEDATDLKFELTSYPNDYGSTSPYYNNGVFQRSELDYLGAPQAWDITTGLGTTIVFSDARINAADPDFSSKLSFYNPCSCQNIPYNPTNLRSMHGTGVASFGAAQGDNNYGSTGICYDCDILMTDYGLHAIDNLLALASMGYRVFNMSWIYWTNYEALENAMNTLVEEYDAVLVAAAGNRSSYQTNSDFYDAYWDSANHIYIPEYTGVQYGYPASYDGVISVTNINHSFKVNDSNAPNNMFWSSPTIANGQNFVEDSFSPNVDITDVQNPIGLKYNGFSRTLERPDGLGGQVISPNGLTHTNVSNKEIDILASSDLSMVYHKFSELGLVEYIEYGGTTSQVTPMVSATAALMITVNECLTASEVDQIIKLTSKDVEHNPMNQAYYGMIGAGKLEIGKAVGFSNELKKNDGNAEIKDHTFYRWDFRLQNINNNLRIENVQFIKNTSVHFTAKNSILLEEGTLLEPQNSILNGPDRFVLLETDSLINNACSRIIPKLISDNKSANQEIRNMLEANIFPNPTQGNFKVILNKQLDYIEYTLYDYGGKIILNDFVYNTNSLKIINQSLSPGMYILKIITPSETLSKKIIIY